MDVGNGWQLWGERYKRKLDDIFDVQEEIAKIIFEKLRVRLSPTEEKKLARRETKDPGAYELYLRARHEGSRMAQQPILRALDYCRQALAIDPAFASALAWMSWMHTMAGVLGLFPKDEAIQNARPAALRALEINEDLADAHAALALVNTYSWDWERADRHCRRVLELDPGSELAIVAVGQVALNRGQIEKALEATTRALELSPKSLLAIYLHALAQFFAGQYDAALEGLRRCLQLESEFSVGHLVSSFCYARKGMLEEAFAHSVKATGLGIPDAGLRGLIYALAGSSEEARNALNPFKETQANGFLSFLLGWAYAALGENDLAMGCLEAAYDDHAGVLPTIGIRPGTEPLRSDPRFQDLLRRMGVQA